MRLTKIIVTLVLICFLFVKFAVGAPVEIDGVKFYQGGLKGEYFTGTNFETLRLTRVDSTVNYYYAEFPPHASMEADNFSVRWTGNLKVPAAATYTFYTISDDGVKVWIDEKLLIDDWKVRPGSSPTRLEPVSNTGTLELTEGFHDIRIEYFENIGKGVMKLFWESQDRPKDVIFPEYLFNEIEEKEITTVETTFRYGEKEYLSFDLNPGGHTHLATYLQAGMEATLGFVRGKDVVVKKKLPPIEQGTIEQVGKEKVVNQAEGVFATKTIFGLDSNIPWKIYDQGEDRFLEMTFGIKGLDKGQMEDCATEVAVMNCDRTCDYVISANYTVHYDNAPFSPSDFAQVAFDYSPKTLVLNKTNTVALTFKAVNTSLKNFKTVISVPYKIQDNVVEILSYPKDFELSRHAHGDVVISQSVMKNGDYNGEEPVVISLTPSKNELIQFSLFYPGGEYDKKFASSAEWSAFSDKAIENPSTINVSYRKDVIFDVASGEIAGYDPYSGEPIPDISKAARVTGLGGQTWYYRTIGHAILDLVSRWNTGLITAHDELNGTDISISIKDRKVISVTPKTASVIYSKGAEDSRAFANNGNIETFDRQNQPKRFQILDFPAFLKYLNPTDRAACSFCSKSLIGRDMTFFNIFTVDGESYITCCAHCGISLMGRIDDKVKNAVCRDYDSQEIIDARKAQFLITEEPLGCCVPAILPFVDEDTAKSFRSKYGGEIFSFSSNSMEDIKKILGEFKQY